ncbi:MAG: 2'-5' RNA ligase family protein [Candidatus Saccharimonadales bacterium]
MQKYCLVHLIEKLQDGVQFTATNYWPLHITVVSNFSIDIGKQQLIDMLDKELSLQKSFIVTAGDDAYFGKDKNIHVTLMSANSSLQQLHEILVRLLSNHAAIFDEPGYNNEGYKAHATIQQQHRLKLHDNVSINNLSLVDMFPDSDITQRKILRTFPFTP